jgi:hypothetical protein
MPFMYTLTYTLAYMYMYTSEVPMRIWVRIGHPHPLVCRKVTKWGVPLDETRKMEVPCHSRCGTIKIPPCSKAMSAEQLRLNFAALN